MRHACEPDRDWRLIGWHRPCNSPVRSTADRQMSVLHRRHSGFFIWLCSLLAFLIPRTLDGVIVEHSTNVGFEKLGPYSHIVAMGDFNSDKHTDVFILNTGNSTHPVQALEIWLWEPTDGIFVFNSDPSARIDFGSRVITNVVPGDWNYDGKLDVLVSGPGTDAWSRAEVNLLTIYFGDHVGFAPIALDLPPSIGQVLVCDVNNDLKLDLFGQKYVHDAPPTNGTHSSRRRRDAHRRLAQHDALDDEVVLEDAVLVDETLQHRVYWVSSVQNGIVSFQVVPQQLDQSYPAWPARPGGLTIGPQPTLRNPHSHAWVDLNGDCMADLLVTSTDETKQQTYLEIWLNHAEVGPVFHSISILPDRTGQISVADLDNDGNVDILFPVFSERNAKNEIHLYYNNASQLCGSQYDLSDGKTGCIPESNLCTADDNFSFDFMRYHTASDLIFFDSPDTVVYFFPKDAKGGYMYSAYTDKPDDKNPATEAPFQLRLGDINLDGYPDLLLALTPLPAVPDDPYGVAELWYSVPCKNTGLASAQPDVENVLCSTAAEARGRRAFSSRGLDQANNLLSDVSGAYAGASFFDLGDNGEMDILFSAISPVTGIYSTHAFVNNFNEDAYFLTTIASNGVCPDWCPSDPRHPNPKPYGVNMVGATFKIAFTDLAGKQHMSIGNQLTQSGYLTLQTPYVTFGLGRTNNFIDSFFFGIGINATQHSRAWVSVVPNSQIIVFPYPPDDPDEWTLELFVSPTSHLFWVCVAWACLLTVLAMVIGYLHLQEKKEDEKEKRKHQLLFTF